MNYLFKAVNFKECSFKFLTKTINWFLFDVFAIVCTISDIVPYEYLVKREQT